MAELRYPFTDDGVCSALKALGTTSEAIHTNLFEMGYRGKPEADDRCPVARYLVGVVDGAERAHVYIDTEGDAVVQVGAGVSWHDGNGLHKPVGQFVRQFDLGLFPDLIEGLPEELEESRG